MTQYPKTFSAFIGFGNLPEKVQAPLVNNRNRLPAGIIPEYADNFHVTLLYLGRLTTEQLNLVGEELRKPIRLTHGPQPMFFAGNNAVLSEANRHDFAQQVSWQGEPKLSLVVKKIVQMMQELLELEFAVRDPLVPHITLGRLEGEQPMVRSMVDAWESQPLGQPIQWHAGLPALYIKTTVDDPFDGPRKYYLPIQEWWEKQN